MTTKYVYCSINRGYIKRFNKAVKRDGLRYFWKQVTSASLRVENIPNCFWQQSESSLRFDQSGRNFFDQICHGRPNGRSSMIFLFGQFSLGKAFGNSGHGNSVQLGWFHWNFKSEFLNFVQILSQNPAHFRGEVKTDDVFKWTRNHLGLRRIVFCEKAK